jgi:hypothetical protein
MIHGEDISCHVNVFQKQMIPPWFLKDAKFIVDLFFVLFSFNQREKELNIVVYYEKDVSLLLIILKCIGSRNDQWSKM